MTALAERPAADGVAPRHPPAPPRNRNRGRSRRAPRPPRKPLPATQGGAAVLSVSSAMLMILCTWMVLHLLVFAGLAQERTQELLHPELRRQLADATAPVGPVVEPGAPVALLRIPRLDLEQVVVEGTAAGDLLAGPGHRRNTVLPGQVGVSAVYGRSTTYGGPFRHIASLSPGDLIRVAMAQGELDFRVLGVRREGDPLPLPPAEGVARLTLVTSEGQSRFTLLRALSPGHVVYVDAEADEGFPAPGGRPSTLPDGEEAMDRGVEALPLVTLHLALLLALAVGVIVARQRWSTVLVWVVATPPALALAWALTDAAMRLLPNLI